MRTVYKIKISNDKTIVKIRPIKTRILRMLDKLFPCKHEFGFGIAKKGLGKICKKCGKKIRMSVYKYHAGGSKTKID